MIIHRKGARSMSLALAVLALMGLALGSGVEHSVAQAQVPVQPVPEIGPVELVALDAAGNGWAWASSPPQTFASSFLLRIENGAWRVALSSEKNSDVLPPATRLTRLVVTDAGASGWAIGFVLGEPDLDIRPVVLRLNNGQWERRRTSLPLTTILHDLTITPDGSDGWMTAWDTREQRYKLLRLRNGSWDYVALPAGGGALDKVALSPDGKQGWAVGPRSESRNVFAQHAAYRLIDGKWTAVPGDLYIPTFVPVGIAADNAGNGWVINQIQPDFYAYDNSHSIQVSRTITSPVPVAELSYLYYLSRSGRPIEIDLDLTDRSNGSGIEFWLNGLSVDGNGRGWAIGSIFLGIANSNPPEQIYRYEPALFRLEGGRAQRVTPSEIGLKPEQNSRPIGVGQARNGAHTWLGGHSAVGFGHVQEITEPWTHQAPPAATPLPGLGRCFAEVPHCLRGVFASYWQQKGGLDLFGYPITPEVRETIGGKEYIVQYTQRARFEHHPENPAPNNVLLGLLGNALVESRLNEEPFKPKPPGIVPSEEWFQQTQHNVRPPFLDYWKKNGGLPVYGLPRSEAFEEKNAADGKLYTVQYFERNRLEYHPENRGTKFEMLLGLLGAEQFKKSYGYAP